MVTILNPFERSEGMGKFSSFSYLYIYIYIYLKWKGWMLLSKEMDCLSSVCLCCYNNAFIYLLRNFDMISLFCSFAFTIRWCHNVILLRLPFCLAYALFLLFSIFCFLLVTWRQCRIRWFFLLPSTRDVGFLWCTWRDTCTGKTGCLFKWYHHN